MDRLGRIRELRDAYESALDDAERLRDEYHREIVKLHRSGMSLREIAEGLGISHQRVHQIVSPLEEKPRSRKARRVAAGGAIAALALIVGVGSGVLMSRSSLGPSNEPARPPTERAVPADESVVGFCVVVDSPSGSTFATFTLVARCGAEMVRSGSVVALDPDNGDVLAVSGVTRAQTLQQALSTIIVCGHGTLDEVLVAYGPGTTACPLSTDSTPNGRSHE